MSFISLYTSKLHKKNEKIFYRNLTQNVDSKAGC